MYNFFITAANVHTPETRMIKLKTPYGFSNSLHHLKEICQEIPLFITKNEYTDFKHGIIGNEYMQIPIGYEKLEFKD